MRKTSNAPGRHLSCDPFKDLPFTLFALRRTPVHSRRPPSTAQKPPSPLPSITLGDPMLRETSTARWIPPKQHCANARGMPRTLLVLFAHKPNASPVPDTFCLSRAIWLTQERTSQ